MKDPKLFQQQALVRNQTMMLLEHSQDLIHFAATSPKFSRGSMYRELIRHKEMIKDLEDYINGEPKLLKWDNVRAHRKIIKNLEETAQMYKDYLKRITGCEYCD